MVCRKHLGTGKREHIDHCHRTGRVRGILCAGCNSGIGKLGDSVAGLRRALAYLEAFEVSVLAGMAPKPAPRKAKLKLVG